MDLGYNISPHGIPELELNDAIGDLRHSAEPLDCDDALRGYAPSVLVRIHKRDRIVTDRHRSSLIDRHAAADLSARPSIDRYPADPAHKARAWCT